LIKNKIIQLSSTFTKELPTADEAIDSIYISGYASATSADRSGDVVPSVVWDKGMTNYLKNPIILAFHDHDDPIGRMVEHKIDSKGLWIKARISAAAEVFNLIKDNVLTAFSVSFRVLDAEYKPEVDLLVIKELELIEISVVSVPCNQDTLFSLSKSFDNDEEYKLFKSQFAPQSESAKGLETSTVAKSKSLKEIGMNPEELAQMIADAASKAADAATARMEKKIAETEAAKAKEIADEALMQKRIKEALASVTPSTTGTEQLLADITKRFEDQAAESKKTLDGLEAIVRDKAAELEALQKSKMTFTSGKTGEITYAEKEKAVILSRMIGKRIEDTKFGNELVVKYGGTGQSPHLASATWELEVSLNMEAEVRRRLVVAPTLRAIAMQTNVMTMPVNPEAGLGTWVQNSQFGAVPGALGAAGASAGNTVVHALKEITLNAYKVATNEYLAYEEEEDSLIAVLPIVRDAMVRRVARTVDKAFLVGAGAGADPVRGLGAWAPINSNAAANATTYSGGFGTAYSALMTPSLAAGLSTSATSNLRALRKGLIAWGLDPSELVFVVSTDVYYALLEDTTFQTMDKVGDRATILTGQIGMVGGTPVLVSAELPATASGSTSALTNIGALCYAPGNYVVGNQRGLRMDTQDLVETQRKVLVASLRTGMTQITSNLGAGVAAMRWAA
jgi:HK97 family phage prohead protease